MMTKTETIQTICSGCMEHVVISLNSNLQGTATTKGKSAPVFYEGGDEEETYSLIMWDCAHCDYADSYDRNYHA